VVDIQLLAAINQRTNKALPPNHTCRPALAIAHGLFPPFVGLQFAQPHNVRPKPANNRYKQKQRRLVRVP
jgi:hypothetical protein